MNLRAPTPHLDEARASSSPTVRLAVESLEQRLARCLPGARVRYYWSSDVAERWRVKLAGRVLSRCHSEREAIDVAITLWGSR